MRSQRFLMQAQQNPQKVVTNLALGHEIPGGYSLNVKFLYKSELLPKDIGQIF